MKKIIFVFVIILLVNGCAGSAIWYGQKRDESMNVAARNNANMSKIAIGMSRNQITQIMGSPNKTEAYTIDNKAIEFLFYRTHACDMNLNDIDSYFTPIAIEKNSVIGWGRNFYDQTIKFKSEIKQDININNK